MALLNENRVRVPLVDVLPVDSDDGGIRGQMRMSKTEADATIEVCTTSDGGLPSTLTVTGSVGDAVYTSVALGDDSALISVQHAVGGVDVPVVTVDGYAILVTGTTSTTNAQIKTAIDGSAAAAALVTVVASAGTLLAQAAAFLTGGERGIAFDTTNDITLTANEPGQAGNSITIEIVDENGKLDVDVVVTGTAIVVTADAGVATNQDIFNALNSNREAFKLVTVSGTGATTVVAQGETNLAGGSTTAVWTTMAVA